MKFSIPVFIRQNFLRKLVAVFFAVLVWLAVNNQIHETTRTLYNLEVAVVKDVDTPLQIKEETITVSVKLEGRPPELEHLSPSNVQPFVDISGVSDPGRQRCKVQVRVDAEAEVNVVKVKPSKVAITLIRSSDESASSAPQD